MSSKSLRNGVFGFGIRFGELMLLNRTKLVDSNTMFCWLSVHRLCRPVFDIMKRQRCLCFALSSRLRCERETRKREEKTGLTADFHFEETRLSALCVCCSFHSASLVLFLSGLYECSSYGIVITGIAKRKRNFFLNNNLTSRLPLPYPVVVFACLTSMSVCYLFFEG